MILLAKASSNLLDWTGHNTAKNIVVVNVKGKIINETI
jgi:hypothetical protein